MTDMAQRVAVPDDLDAPGLPEAPDYVDAYTASVPGAAGRTAREWTDAVLGAAPDALLPAVRTAQRAMGLRLLPPRAPNLALGWAVLDDRPDQVVLGVEGLLFTPRVVVSVRHEALLITTFLRIPGAFGRAVWAVGSPLHRATARSLATVAEQIDAP